MNDVEDRNIDTDVTVQLSGCVQEDAKAVFDVLDRVFVCEDMSVSKEPNARGPETTVWLATFDTARPASGEPLPPAHLTAEVGALLTGGYHAVDEIEKALAGSFDVRSLQSVSGDQETEARMLLASR
ncbi:hypothetical protein [Streptomyces purpureus]|uniref:Uncharacterized protein n=1 Tax=Streptomyces purpureus TaxID=1951 RepID=A0A918LM85_9ACTN|nr:hypothetical protein [Streptomyces purpureus]GGT16919.1 hypothetical protein GCM10014713_07300 [Streptomyces purpureus]